ncbi:hypothetical protein C8R43DRAFT_940369 [Mycena crocata]|nr:hypothetical protein C8R43DRAFT_940369 [Mycena crocata]
MSIVIGANQWAKEEDELTSTVRKISGNERTHVSNTVYSNHVRLAVSKNPTIEDRRAGDDRWLKEYSTPARGYSTRRASDNGVGLLTSSQDEKDQNMKNDPLVNCKLAPEQFPEKKIWVKKKGLAKIPKGREILPLHCHLPHAAAVYAAVSGSRFAAPAELRLNAGVGLRNDAYN